jgi:hypothetical protein
MRAKVLKASELPIEQQSNKDKEDPNRTNPKTAIDDPSLAKLRSDNDDPTFAKSKTAREAPI